MRPCSYTELFDALIASDAKAVLRRCFRDDSCINSTRVLLEVFRAFGLAASPFSVRAQVFSNGFVRRAEREGRIPQSEPEKRAWFAEPGVHSVGIGFPHSVPSDKWAGHLVVRAGQQYLLDATIDQANRPAKGIRLPDLLLLDNVSYGFWAGRQAALTVSPDGSAIRYEAAVGNEGYRLSPGWRLRPEVEGVAYREIVALLTSAGGLAWPSNS